MLVFYWEICILWVIVCIGQGIIAFLAGAICRLIRAVVEQECIQIGDSCHWNTGQQEPIPVNCSDIKTIESCRFVTIMIIESFGTILTLAGSIIDCMGTCCARPEPASMAVVQQPGYPVTGVTTTRNGYPGPEQAYAGMLMRLLLLQTTGCFNRCKLLMA